MATNPLKITFPANLPKNEKDLICMLLAGRLKDLWGGKLFCAELAVNDLIKDVTDKMDGATGGGLDVLKELRAGLGGLQGAITGMKAASGYDTILNKMNQSLGQLSNVFSLGGLCPSPITPPKIPDVLANLNQNMFGQANNVINALAQASSPKMCFGAGPKGFGVNWNSMTGSLKNLKNALKNFKNTPKQVFRQFTNNLRSQSKRLNSELARLQKNLQDPLGIGKQQSVAKALQRAKNISGDYKVKDRNGVEHKDPIRSMIPGDIVAVLEDNDPEAAKPIMYRTEPVLDYCGDIVGFKKVALSGDPAYMGWDTAPDAVNTLNPTTNPKAAYKDFDYTFVEDNGALKIYDRDSVQVSSPNIKRGVNYKMGFFLTTMAVSFSKAGGAFTDGIKVGQNPKYGLGSGAPGLDIIEPGSQYNPSFTSGEVEWAAQMDSGTDGVSWSANNLATGAVVAAGAFAIDQSSPVSIPQADRAHDVAMAFKKALMHLNTVGVGSMQREIADMGRTYSVSVNTAGVSVSQSVSCIAHKDEEYYLRFPYVDPDTLLEIEGTGALEYEPGEEDETRRDRHQRDDVKTRSDAIRLDCKLARYDIKKTDPVYTVASGYYIAPNYDQSPTNNDPEEGRSEFRTVTGNLVFKLYVDETTGLALEEFTIYTTSDPRDSDQAVPLASMKMTGNLTLMNDVKLPFKDPYSYRLSLPLGDAGNTVTDYNVYDNDEVTYSLNGSTMICQFTRFTEADIGSMTENDFLLIIEIDAPDDGNRTYVTTNPKLKRLRFFAKGINGTIDYRIN